jgi:hypothetical protein
MHNKKNTRRQNKTTAASGKLLRFHQTKDAGWRRSRHLTREQNDPSTEPH